jgi:hypothetical protein
MRTGRFAGNGEGNSDLALALRVKTRSSDGAGCGGKEFPSCEHRTLDSSLLRLERPLFSLGKNTTGFDSLVWEVCHDARDDDRPVDCCNSPIRFRLSLLAARTRLGPMPSFAAWCVQEHPLQLAY